REYSKMALENTNIQRFQVFSYLTIGNSLLFSNYELAQENFLKGLSVSVQNENYNMIFQQALCFLNNVGRKENKWMNFETELIMDLKEQAHC
ncbi:hypothetical protein DWA27_20195, partial [Acinetobacter baumannii]